MRGSKLISKIWYFLYNHRLITDKQYCWFLSKYRKYNGRITSNEYSDI